MGATLCMLLVQLVGWWHSDDVACDYFAPADIDATAADEGDVDEVVVDVVPIAGGGSVVDKDVVDEVVLVAVGS
jgi:hypothetical protein